MRKARVLHENSCFAATKLAEHLKHLIAIDNRLASVLLVKDGRKGKGARSYVVLL